jgi:uncharacterized membrane protein YdjX (TVP38/TMEM64 family)
MAEDHNMRGIIAIAVALAITAAILLSDPVPAAKALLGDFGYLGVFLVMLVSTSTVFLPAPGLAAAFLAGSSWNPLLVGVFGGLGAAIGEMVGYLFGYGGKEIAEAHHDKAYVRVQGWMDRYGFFLVFAFAAVPNPLFDLAGIAAGASSYPPWKFFIAVLLGSIVKVTVIAMLGQGLL